MENKKLSRKERHERMENIHTWINQQIEQRVPVLLGTKENVTANQIFTQLRDAIFEVKTLKKEKWFFLSDGQWENLVDTQGSIIENNLRQTFGAPPLEDQKKPKKETDKKSYFGFIEAMTGKKSIWECLQTKDGRNDLIQAQAMQWGFVIPLSQAIILLTDKPDSPDSMVPDRKALVQNLIKQVAKLGFFSRDSFYRYIEAWVKVNVPNVPANKDFYQDFPKWLQELKNEVNQELQQEVTI